MHSWLLFSIILLLHFLHRTVVVGAARLTIMNNCSESIWAVVQGSADSKGEEGDEVRVGGSMSLVKPDRWNGRVWGKTGCHPNRSTPTCNSNMTAVTLAEFSFAISPDFYDVSVVGGYNLPLAVKPTGSGCGSTGCIADLLHYFIAFCPSSYSFLVLEGMPPTPSPAPISNNNPGRNRSKKIITVVSVSVIGGITIVVAVAVAIYCFLKRRKSSQNGPKRERNRYIENLLLQHGALAPKRYKYSEIKKITKSLSDKLGKGGFGSVYRGTLADGRPVAVKLLSETMDSNGEEFMNEVASISRTSHVNIVTLLGFCYEGNKSALVYEYMPNKSLDKFLGNEEPGENGKRILDLNRLYEIAVGIARGLEYLHTGCTTRIVHFDIKPQNILLDEDLCPKISDFGLAKLCKKKQSVLSVLGTRGTAGYIAPEVFSRNFGGVSHKSDVYSYGMMLLEMAGAKKGGGTAVMQSSENYFPDRIYEKIIIDVRSNLDDESVMIEEGEEKRRKMLLVGFWCIQTVPAERPSISKAVEMLEGSLDSIQIPPKPFLFSTVVPDHQPSSSSFSTENIAAD